MLVTLILLILLFVFFAVLTVLIFKLYGTIKAIENYTISLSERINNLEKKYNELPSQIIQHIDCDDLK